MRSRAATNELLAVLRNGDWRMAAWTRFALLAARRSAAQALGRPRALAEVTVLHAAVAVVAELRTAGPRHCHRWTLTSWALVASHLGMLEHHRSIGWANAVTLVRANLPALGDDRCLGVVAIGSDLADGRLARHLGVTSPFGAAADTFADAAFWTWFGTDMNQRGRCGPRRYWLGWCPW